MAPSSPSTSVDSPLERATNHSEIELHRLPPASPEHEHEHRPSYSRTDTNDPHFEKAVVPSNDNIDPIATNEDVRLETADGQVDRSSHGHRAAISTDIIGAHVTNVSGSYEGPQSKAGSTVPSPAHVGATTAAEAPNALGHAPVEHTSSQSFGKGATGGDGQVNQQSLPEPLQNVTNYVPVNDDYEAKYEPDTLGDETGMNARVWRVYLDEAEIYDREMVDEWKDTVDTLLVFAGLFSAVVTTFVAQTSQSLQVDYTQTTASLLTELVALQRAAAQGLSPSVVPASALNASTQSAPASAIDRAVNGFWFTSLALSLSTALFCILVKQWAQNYASTISGPPRERALLRQMRFLGIKQWHVRDIVGFLPFLLHAALLLFFIGLVIFLNPLDETIGVIMVLVAGMTYVAYVVSTILPVFFVNCSYRTPLSDYIYATSALAKNTRSLASVSILWCLIKFRGLCGMDTMTHIRLSLDELDWTAFNVKKLKAQEISLVQDNKAEISHFTVEAMRSLLRTTTRPSVTSIVYQSFGGYDQTMTTILNTLQSIRSPHASHDVVRGVISHWASTVDDVFASSVTQAKDEHKLCKKIERISRGLTRLLSHKHSWELAKDFDTLWEPSDSESPAESKSRVELAITMLEKHKDLFNNRNVSALCATLHALCIASAVSGLFWWSQKTRDRVRQVISSYQQSDVLSKGYQNLIDGLDPRDGPQLWAFFRYIYSIMNSRASLSRSIIGTYLMAPFRDFNRHLKILLILDKQLQIDDDDLDANRALRQEIMFSGIPVMEALYCMLYHPVLGFFDEYPRVLNHPDTLERGAELFMYNDRLFLLLLSIITGFTSHHDALWSTNQSSRVAIAQCLRWAVYIVRSRSLSPNMLDTVREEHDLWKWKKSTVRGMWSKNIMHIAETIEASSNTSDASPSIFDLKKIPINLDNLVQQVKDVLSIARDYYEPDVDDASRHGPGGVSSTERRSTGSESSAV